MKLNIILLLTSIQSKPLLDSFQGNSAYDGGLLTSIPILGPLVGNTFGGLISSVPILGPLIAGTPIKQGQYQNNPIYQTNLGQQPYNYPYY
jgi:hypothetical protein